MTIARLIALTGLVFAAAACDNTPDDCLYLPTGQADFAAYELRDPMSGLCQSFGGGGDCIDSCGPCANTWAAEAAEPDWAQCYSACEALDEASCKAATGCRAAYEEGAFHDCWSVAPSGPVQGGDCTSFDAYECSRHDDCVALHAAGSPIGSFMTCAPEGTVQDPGSCVGDVTCASPQPDCPADTIPGRRNGCWTGYCIPLAQCDALPACSELVEPECIGRSDCAPIYQGMNCTCNGASCTCQSWVFDRCE